MTNAEKRDLIRSFLCLYTYRAEGFVTKKDLWTAFYRIHGNATGISKKEFCSYMDEAVYLEYEVSYRHDIQHCGSTVRGYRGIQLREQSAELPELTATAFHCPDCPKEAEILSVLPGGEVLAFDKNVQYLATLELKCKFPGKVERPHKVVAEDPVSNLVEPGELNWDSSYYKYSPSADSYYGLLPGDPDKVAVLGCGTIVRLMPKDAEDVGITEYTPIELIGRSIMVYTSAGIRYDVITGITEAGAIITGTNPGGITQKAFFGHCRFLDGSLPFKVVH